jgi:MFS family permease
MQRVAEGWLAYRLTHSAWILGLVAFAGRAPALLSPLGGVVADRVSRYRLLLWTQSLSMVQALVLAGFTLQGAITPGRLIAFALILGLINAVDNPGRQSFFIEIVGREDLPSAIALNSSLVNVARVLGPVLAGLIVAWAGEGFCFLINGLSFTAVLACLLAMRLVPKQAGKKGGRGFVLEGLVYAWRTPHVREPLVLLGAVTFAGLPYVTLLPIFVGSIYQRGPAVLGWLMGASGVGAVCGAIWLASRPGMRGLGRALVEGASLASAGLIVFAFSSSLPVAFLCMPIIGWGVMVTLAGTNTLLQSQVPDQLRGRVMGLYATTFLGIGPFGSLLAGRIANYWGAPRTIFLGGLGCALAGLWFAWRIPLISESARRPEVGAFDELESIPPED